MEIVDLEKGKLIEKAYLTIGNTTVSRENRFILDIPLESSGGNSSKFYTRHLIPKKRLYFDLMVKTEVLKNYGDKLATSVVRLLDES